MIRTRNFLIYMCTLVFLVAAVGYTILGDMSSGAQVVATELERTPSAASAYGAVASATPDDRAAYVAWLRGEIAAGEGYHPDTPVTLETVDETPPQAEVVELPAVTERSPQLCGTQENVGSVLGSWNPDAVEVRVVEGARIVLGADTVTEDDTAPVPATPLLQLPIRTVRAAADSCLPHVIAGVTEDGTLIGNGDASAYRGYSADMLVGYALDGLPIHGAAPGLALDACGGTNTPSGYRYHLRADEPFVLGCFAATPATFIQ